KRTDLDGLRFGMLAATGGVRVDTIAMDPPWLDQHDGFRYWAKDWDIAVDSLHIVRSTFALHSDSIASPAVLFDPAHLVCTDINLDARGLAMNNERLDIDLKGLSMRGGPKRTSIELAVAIKATPAEVTISNGSLAAAGTAVAFSGEAKPGDLAAAFRAPYDVPISAEARAALSMNELMTLLEQVGVELPAAMANDERWETRASFSGTARRADRMDLDLAGDQGSRIRMQGRLSGLDQWPRTTFDVELDELVMGHGLRQVMLAFAPPDVPLPQRLSAKGSASRTGDGLSGTLTLDSDLGHIVGSAEVSGWSGRVPDDLNVDLSLAGLDVGRLIGDTAFDPVSMKIIATGERLNGSTRSGSLSLTPTVLTYGGNDFSSLRLNGEAEGDSVRIDVTSEAEAAHFLLHANGTWPEAGDSLAFDLDLAMRKLGLKDLGLTGHVLNADGTITGRVAFLPDGFGRVSLNAPGLRLSNASREFRFARFALNGLLATDSTAIDLESDAITIAYHTNMNADSLVSNMQARIARHFSADATITPARGEHTDLLATLPRTEWLTGLVLQDLEAIELRKLEGHYDGDLDVFKFVVDVPHVDYAGVDVHGLEVDVDAAGERLTGAVRVVRVQRDSLFVKDLSVEAVNAVNGFDATVLVRDGESDRYRIGTSIRRENGMRVLHLAKDATLNSTAWAVDPGNGLFFTDQGMRAEHFELSAGSERVALRTTGATNRIEFNGFELTTLTEIVSSMDSVAFASGTLDGTIDLPISAEGQLAVDVTIKDLHATGVELGTLTLKATESNDNHYKAHIGLQDQVNHVTGKADADLSGSNARVQADADLVFGDLSFLKPFVSEYVYTLGGGLNGNIHYHQDGERIALTGRTTFSNAEVGLIQTGAIYRLPNETVNFTNEGIELDNVSVLDSAGNRFQLDGRVLTAADKVPVLDLRLRTDRFQLVNSTIEQNRMFFGDLFSSIDLQIGGTAIKPVVRGDVGVLEGTRLSVVLPGSRVELVDHQGIVVFTTEGAEQDSAALRTDSEMLRDSLAAQLPGVELDLRIHLDKRAEFAVVIDPTTGDQATFRGGADLVFRYSPDGDLYLSGPFTVAEGGYTLAFYGLVKKRFELVPGGTVIWSGDPLAGIMDIQARYRSESAPYPLVANGQTGGISESERNRLQTRLPFDVLINFRETVKAPVITFGLDLDRMSRNNFQSVSNRLDQLAQPANQEELNRQVFGLLVLNTFIEDVTGDEAPTSSLATTAARNSVNSILTDQLNHLTGQMIKGMDVQLGVNTYDQSEGGETYQRTTVDYKVTQRILNDRVSIEAGGSIGADERDQSVGAVGNNNNAQYAVSYDLTSDGRLRLRAFHENAYDLYDGEIVNDGIAITITREFEENARDRERRRAEIRKQQETEHPEKDGTDH
ncbi:MAG: translocation/assembly module TamB domain-containing protein, partial [Flavobacteriales bacterium]